MEIRIRTKKREEIVEITEHVEKILEESKIKEGICFLFVPHATAGITINEGNDPNVREDIINFLSEKVPKNIWLHDKIDNNADAHIKSSLIGQSTFIPIKDGKLLLGVWQKIMFCEFDGPKERRIIVEILKKK